MELDQAQAKLNVLLIVTFDKSGGFQSNKLTLQMRHTARHPIEYAIISINLTKKVQTKTNQKRQITHMFILIPNLLESDGKIIQSSNFYP